MQPKGRYAAAPLRISATYTLTQTKELGGKLIIASFVVSLYAVHTNQPTPVRSHTVLWCRRVRRRREHQDKTIGNDVRVQSYASLVRILRCNITVLPTASGGTDAAFGLLF